jgi:hypothetical protein
VATNLITGKQSDCDDFLADFYAAPRRTRQSSRQLPHVRFGNASDDEALIEFVCDFGPVLGSIESLRSIAMRTSVVQNLGLLRAEQRMFAIALNLICIVNEFVFVEAAANALQEKQEPNSSQAARRLKKDDLSKLRQLAALNSELEAAVARANAIGAELHVPTLKWHCRRSPAQDEDPLAILSNSYEYLCALFNQFPTRLVPSRGTVLESPQVSSSGIKPLLYFLIRELYLQRYKLQMCKRQDCSAFFIPDRSNAEYCSLRCSNLQQQRKSYARRRVALDKCPRP